MNRCATTLLLPLVISACGDNAATPAIPTPIAPSPPTSANLILRGFVYDTAFRPVAGVTVEIIDGPHAGTSMTTSELGTFEFTAEFVRGSLLTLRATREGYATATRSFTIPTSVRSDLYVSLPLNSLAPPVDIAGEYDLTLTADRACVDLPEEVRTRKYEVEIVPLSVPTSLRGVVYGASFLDGYNWFTVGIAGNHVSFIVDFDGPTIVERIAERTYLAIDGSGGGPVGTSKPLEITFAFEGYLFYCALNAESPGAGYSGCFPSDSTAVRSSCQAKEHRLTLRRH